jgi:fibronectin type 3 domain-containing protein
MNVTFAPAASGSVTGGVTITSTASNSPLAISLSGTGIVVTHSATLSWTASTSIVVGYNVYRGTIAGGPYTKLNSSVNVPTTYIDSSVLSGRTYYYVVTAVDSNNVESIYSNQVTAVIP